MTSGAVVALLRDHYTRFLDLRDENAAVTSGDHLDALVATIKTRGRVNGRPTSCIDTGVE